MTREERAQIREANRLKNQRRRAAKSRSTVYAQKARDLRRRTGGVFGNADPSTFNVLAEGTAAMRKAET